MCLVVSAAIASTPDTVRLDDHLPLWSLNISGNIAKIPLAAILLKIAIIIVYLFYRCS